MPGSFPQGHAAASPPPRSPFTGGSRHLQRAESGRHSLQPLQKSPHERSNGHLQRNESSSRLQRPGSGGSQGPSHAARPAQSMDRHAGAELSSAPLRQRPGAQPRDSAFARPPSEHQHQQPYALSHQRNGPPGAGSLSHEWRRHEPSHLTQTQHHYGPLSGQAQSSPHRTGFGQRFSSFPGQVRLTGFRKGWWEDNSA